MCGLQVSLTINVAVFTTQSLYLRLMRFNSAPRLMKSVYVFDLQAYGRPALAPSLFLSEPHSCLRGCAAGSQLVFRSKVIMKHRHRRSRQTTLAGRGRCTYALGALYFSIRTHAREIIFGPESCFNVFDMRCPSGYSGLLWQAAAERRESRRKA